MIRPKYGRVVLKVSGEALAGNRGFGIDTATLGRISEEIVEVYKSGVEIAIVVGGGNFWRGEREGMDRTTADHMGILATVIIAGTPGRLESGAYRPGCRRRLK